MKAVAPSRAILLLMTIGFIDLFTTAWLHANGHIVELNPLMKPLIEQSEWLFGFVKAMTLVAAWVVMASYARINRPFVRVACLAGSIVYLVVWSMWFFGTHGA
jgi:hypothetical protein